MFFHRRQLRRSQRAGFVAVNRQFFVEFHHQLLRHLIRDGPQADDETGGAGIQKGAAQPGDAIAGDFAEAGLAGAEHDEFGIERQAENLGGGENAAGFHGLAGFGQHPESLDFQTLLQYLFTCTIR